jgi:hypothetical protein
MNVLRIAEREVGLAYEQIHAHFQTRGWLVYAIATAMHIAERDVFWDDECHAHRPA